MVATKVEKISSCKVKIDIKIPAEKVEKIRRDQEKIVQKEVNIQGFRKGKAPMQMVKSMYSGTIERYTIDEAMQQAFEEGLNENELNPVSPPVVKKIDFDDEKNLEMEVELDVYPEIELKKYTGFRFDKKIYNITDEDVTENIDYIRKQKAIITPVENEAAAGNFVTFSAQELDNTGMPLIGKKYDNIRIQLGEGQFDPDLESQIIGMKTGQERRIEKKYGNNVTEDLAGKVEHYNINMEKVEEEELPDLDEQFVQDMNLDIKTVDELKDRVKHELEHRWGEESQHQFYQQMVQELLHENPFEVPESMVDNYLDKIIEDIRMREKTINEEEVRKRYRTDALFNIKWFHLKEKIAQKEKIEATDEDFKKFMEDLNDDETRKVYETNLELKKRVMNDIFEKKVFDFLVNSSKIKEKKQTLKNRKEVEKV
jgi:trigger factor